MAKPKLQNTCKLCNLVHTHKDLWVEIHTKILEEGAKKTHVCKWLNSQSEVFNANLKEGQEEFPTFNLTNFTRHFKSHVPSIKKMKAELRAAMKNAPRANDGFSTEEQAIAEGVMNAEQDALAEAYKDYPGTVAKLEALVMQDIQTMTEGQGGVQNKALSKIDQRLRLLNSLISVKKSLSEVQRTEQVGGSAVRHSMVRLGEEVLSSVNKLATELKETLKHQLPNSSLPGDVEKMLVSRVVETIKGVYPDILEEVFKLYGIK